MRERETKTLEGKEKERNSGGMGLKERKGGELKGACEGDRG